jgi:THO complex subunit 2
MSILLAFLTDEEETETDEGKISGSILKYAEDLPSLEEIHRKFGFDIVSTWMLCRPLVRSATQNATSQKESDGKVPDKLKRFALTEDLRKAYEAMLPDAIWSMFSPELFEVFYTNSLYDLFCPENVYTTEATRVNKEIERIQQKPKGGQANTIHVGPGQPKNEVEELERLKSVSQRLATDLSKQKEHAESVLGSIEEKKATFFNATESMRDSAKAFLIYCIYPRSIQSPDDAIYCARFAVGLHRLETPGFSTLHYIDELISIVAGSLFGVTEGEAAHLAILLWETWKVVNKWRYEESLFEKEVAGTPGSYMVVSDPSPDAGMESEPQATSHKDFAVLYNAWHASLGAALIGCLKSTEYMHTRTGLVVLTRIVEVFPTRPRLGNKLLRVLSPLQGESSPFPDIRASANAYGTMVLKARDEGKWVEEDAAVAKARAEKEKAATEARKKKIAEQFKELQRDSDKITEEIGPRDGPKDRFDRRREPREVGRGKPSDSDRGRAPQPPSAKENGKSRVPPVARMESGEVSSRDRRDQDDRRGGQVSRSPPPRDAGRGRDRDRPAATERGNGRSDTIGSPPGRPGERQHGAEKWQGDGGTDALRGSRDEARGLGGRFTRNEGTAAEGRGRIAKRSRPPSPEAGADNRGNERNTKRPRLAQDTESNYETRREAGGSSPTRRPRSPQGSSRPRARRSRR